MKKLILFIVLIGTIFLTYKLYGNMEVSDREAYEKDYDKFAKLNYEVTGFYMLDGDFYSVVEYRYNNTKKYKFPTHKKEYLEDKLKYYEEKSYQDRDYYKKLISYVNAELEQTKESDLIKPSKFFMKNMDTYLKRVERLLPLYNKMEGFFTFEFVEDKKDSVTHAYHSRLKEAIKDLQTLKALQKSLPKLPYLFYVLDGGHGKEIPIDDYEMGINIDEK